MKKLLVIITFLIAGGFLVSCESTSADSTVNTSAVETVDDTAVTGGDGTASATEKMTAAEQTEFFKTFVTIGDSLTHGCQSLNVEENRQYYSWPAQLARVMGTEFNQPLIEYPGIGMPNIEDAFREGWFDTWYSTITKFIKCMMYWYRVDRYDNQANLNNFAMAGACVDDVVSYDGTKTLTSITDTLLMSLVGIMNPWICSVVGLVPAKEKSALDQALDRDPTFMAVLIGNNDIIFATIMGDDAKLLMTDIDTFTGYWNTIITKIKAKKSIKGVLLITLPDSTDIPFLQPINNPYHTVTEGADIPEGSKVPFFSTRSSCVSDVITPDQILNIHNRILEVNDIIRKTAAAENWALLDIYQLVKDQLPGGMKLRYSDGSESNIAITADYATGGFFSLDGIHPTSTAYAHLANEAGMAINAFYGTKIPMIDEMAVWEQDSLLQDPIDPRDYPDQMGNMSYLFNIFCRIMAQLM